MLNSTPRTGEVGLGTDVHRAIQYFGQNPFSGMITSPLPKGRDPAFNEMPAETGSQSSFADKRHAGAFDDHREIVRMADEAVWGN